MKFIAIILSALTFSVPVMAQAQGKVTVVVSPVPQPLIEGLNSSTLALQVRQMLDRGALSGTSIPFVQDGTNHEKRLRLGGNPAIFNNRDFGRTIVQGIQRDIVISYGPARQDGIGVHAEVVDSTLTPRSDGSAERSEGDRSQLTGILPDDGLPQALMVQGRAEPGSILLPNTLIVLVEP